MFLFTSDICGEGPRIPRHARTYGDVRSLQEQIVAERVRALASFRRDVADKRFPDSSEIMQADSHEVRAFVESIKPSD